jgi:hypothetical protein
MWLLQSLFAGDMRREASCRNCDWKEKEVGSGIAIIGRIPRINECRAVTTVNHLPSNS